MIKFNTQKPQQYTPTGNATTKLLIGAKSLDDESSPKKTVTNNGTVINSQFGNPYGYGGAWAIENNGSNYLSVGLDSGFAASGDFVWDCFLYPDNTAATSVFFASTTTNALAVLLSGLKVAVYKALGGPVITATNAISNQAYTHVAVVRSGTTISIYYDGVLQNSVTDSFSFVAGNIHIGRDGGGTPYWYTGKYTGLRYMTGTDNGWTGSTITVPTSPYKVV
jgi:hypothetical protein